MDQIKNSIISGHPNLSDDLSDVYTNLLLFILHQGLEDVCEDSFSPSKAYNCTFTGRNYEIIFKVELSEGRGGVTPALNNAVFPSSKAALMGEQKGEAINDIYYAKNKSVLDNVLKNTGNVQLLIASYADIILEYMDCITDYVNWAVSAGERYYSEFLERARDGFSYGGITIFPIIQNDGIGYNFELQDTIRYRLKRDTVFVKSDLGDTE